MYAVLSKHVTNRANGTGLTKAVTAELAAIMKLARLARGEEAVKAPPRETWRMLLANQHEAKLPHNQILTGYTPSKENGNDPA
jgi:hypothetical protein